MPSRLLGSTQSYDDMLTELASKLRSSAFWEKTRGSNPARQRILMRRDENRNAMVAMILLLAKPRYSVFNVCLTIIFTLSNNEGPYGAVVTHLTCNEKIRGSNPCAGLKLIFGT